MSNDPNVSASDWNAFCAYSSPFVFREIIERGAGNIRWDWLPDARGVAVASDYLLQLADHRAPRFPGHGYKLGYRENFGQYCLMITSILERQLWVIERYDRSSRSKIRERLVVSFAWTPLVTNHFKAALCCGRYATMNSVSGLKWAY
jgi:hypothetical protein